MLLDHTLSVVQEAEAAAKRAADVEQIFYILRQLSLDEFGDLLISLPLTQFPALSAALPPMAPAEVQVKWTGSSGMGLYPQTSQFVRILENAYIRHSGEGLKGKTILDFGCGYGRLIRMVYYFTNPINVWGVDPWKSSLDECKKADLPGNFRQSDELPDNLPTDNVRFDFGFSFSVFTHLTDKAAAVCLGAIRKSMKKSGLFIATVRPIEFWPYLYKKKNRPEILDAERAHRATGYGFIPIAVGKSLNYGDSSFDFEFFRQLPNWEFVRYDTLLFDPYQVAIILRAS